MGYEHGWSTLEFLGAILMLIGPFAALAFALENLRIRWNVLDRGERAWAVAGPVTVFVGVALLTFGCTTSLPEPTDPVTVEVDGPTTELEPVVNLYLWLSAARLGFAECEAARASGIEEENAIRAEARQEIQLLHDELTAYVKSGQTGLYCGPACEEMVEFIENSDASVCEP